MAPLVLTIGHSTRAIEELLELLNQFRVELLLDVRTVPKSRHVPQFNADSLALQLRKRGIGYRHLGLLGGLRKPKKDSPNRGWRNLSFRGFADYMQTEEFRNGLNRLLSLARKKTVALMCAEAVPWRCHRSLIADALVVRGIEVRHIISKGNCHLHNLTSFAVLDGVQVTYPDTESQ